VGGCAADTLTTHIRRLPGETPFLIPGLVTPNGDGHNDTWQFTVADGIDPEAYRVILLNRSGGQVWQATSLNQRWEPVTAPDGVYYWKLQRKTDGTTLRTGGLTIRSR
jgi:gliding motility-associated-like protein